MHTSKEIHIDPALKEQLGERYDKLIIKDLHAGFQTGYVHFMNNEVYGFGDGTQGQLGCGQIHYKQRVLKKLDFGNNTIANMAAGYWHNVAVDRRGTCYTWGSGSFGKLGQNMD